MFPKQKMQHEISQSGATESDHLPEITFSKPWRRKSCTYSGVKATLWCLRKAWCIWYTYLSELLLRAHFLCPHPSLQWLSYTSTVPGCHLRPHSLPVPVLYLTFGTNNGSLLSNCSHPAVRLFFCHAWRMLMPVGCYSGNYLCSYKQNY